MRAFFRWATSSIGSKMLMGATGLALVLFVFVHMAANLQVFLGPATINNYAKSLRMVPWLLWGARIGLLLAVTVHIGLAIRLVVVNRAARPVPYAMKRHVATSYAARTMKYSGMLILAYVVYHLLHFTFQKTNPQFAHFTDTYGRHDVYRMVVIGFKSYAVSISYIVANALLCLHLAHGIPSFFQSVGLHGPRVTPAVEKVGPLLAAILFLGFVSVPISVLAGWIKYPA